MKYTAEDLTFLVQLAEAGRFRAVSEHTFPLADVVEAHRCVDTGRKKGSVVLQITPDAPPSGAGAERAGVAVGGSDPIVGG